MGELMVACAALAAGFLLHLALWRIRLPRRQTRALLLAFLGALAAAAASMPFLAEALPWLGLPRPVPWASYALVVIPGVAAVLAYMITYSAVEVDSPSLVMALMIHRAGPEGLPEAELRARLDDALLVDPRLSDLLRDRLAVREGEAYRITPKGAAMARLFALHRRLLGAGKGG